MDFNSCQLRLPDHLTHPGAATSLSFTSMETPNLSLSSCNSLLLAVKNTPGQPQFLPPAPHLQFCLENSAPGTSPIVFVCAGANWEVSASGGLWRCLLVPQPAIFKCEYKVLPPHTPSRDFFFLPPFRFIKLMRVQQIGVSRGQLAEIWAASRPCWGSLKSLEFPAVPRSPPHPFPNAGSGHRWSCGSQRRVLFIQSWHKPSLCLCIPINPECKKPCRSPGCNDLVTWKSSSRGGTEALSPSRDVLCISLPMQTQGRRW